MRPNVRNLASALPLTKPIAFIGIATEKKIVQTHLPEMGGEIEKQTDTGLQ